MKELTEKCLERLETMLDEGHMEKTRTLQRDNFSFQPVERTPVVIEFPVPEEEWPSYNYIEIQEDREKMLLSELKEVYLGAKLKDDRLYGIRANYGTGIIASLFGCPIHCFQDALPVATAAGDVETIKKIIGSGVPDIYGGICGKALRTVAYFREVLSPYPKLSRYIGSSLLDIQGTFDNASIIWGSDIFYGVVDDPSLVTGLIELVTETIRAVVKEHRLIDGASVTADTGCFEYIGGICLRNDSCINLSGEMYETFVKPFDRSLLENFTGNIHFCGKAHQWVERLPDIPGLKAVNPYQGEFYDLVKLYSIFAEHHIAVYQWTVPVTEAAKRAINTGFSRLTSASSFEEAKRLLEKAHYTGWVD